jgi:uncharacterized protein with FMN-binding domain
MKMTAIVVLIIIGIFAVFLGVTIPIASIGLNEIKEMEISDIDISKLSDGIYIGEFKKGRWSYSVKIHIQGRSVRQIELTDAKMAAFKKINHEIMTRVILKNSINVDTYTGATVTSKAFLKAMENALKGGPVKRVEIELYK